MDYVLHITGATDFEPKPKSQFELDNEVYLAEARKKKWMFHNNYLKEIYRKIWKDIQDLKRPNILTE